MMGSKRKLPIHFEENIESFKKLLVELEERPPIYVNRIPTLTKLSSINTAISLWKYFDHDMLSVFHEVKDDEWNRKLTKVLDKIMAFFMNLSCGIPSFVSDLVRDQLQILAKEMKTWLKYHIDRIFFDKKYFTYFLLSNPIWKYDGTIDYMQTAIAMLSSSCTGVKYKYRIFCVYCMKEEIEKLKLLGYVDNDENIDFYSHPLIYYWNCEVEHTRIDFQEFEDFDDIEIHIDESASLESNMITLADNIYAIRYFWKFVDSIDQVAKAEYFINKYGLQFQDFFLRELKTDQLNHLFTAMGPSIIRNYASDAEYLGNAWLVWLYGKNFITEFQYQEMILKMFIFDTYILDFLLGVWKTTPRHFQQSMLTRNSTFLQGLSTLPAPPLVNMRTCISMLLNILPDFDVEMRRNLFKVPIKWTLIFDDLIINYHRPDLLDILLNFCIPEENERIVMRNNCISLRSIELHSLYLINESKWTALEEFLNSCKLPTDANSFKQTVLLSDRFVEPCVRNVLLCRKFDELDKTIDCTFSDVNAAVNFKNELFTSDSVVSMFFTEILLQNQVNEMKELISKYLSEEKYVKLLKEKLMSNFRGIKLGILFFKCDRNVLNEFLLWFFDCQKNVKKFKQSINLDEVFDYMLEQILEIFEREYFEARERDFSELQNLHYDFSKIDDFLLWFFRNKQDLVKQFKYDKIINFYNIEVIKRFLKHNRKINLKEVFKWFISDDEECVNDFELVIGKLHKETKRDSDYYW